VPAVRNFPQFPDTDVANDMDGRRRWRLPSSALRDLMTLSADELAALDLAAKTMTRSGLTVEAETSSGGLREKILALVPRAQAARIETDLEALLRHRDWRRGLSPGSALSARSSPPSRRPSRRAGYWRRSIAHATRPHRGPESFSRMGC
jgi:hypothetical protein